MNEKDVSPESHSELNVEVFGTMVGYLRLFLCRMGHRGRVLNEWHEMM